MRIITCLKDWKKSRVGFSPNGSVPVESSWHLLGSLLFSLLIIPRRLCYLISLEGRLTYYLSRKVLSDLFPLLLLFVLSNSDDFIQSVYPRDSSQFLEFLRREQRRQQHGKQQRKGFREIRHADIMTEVQRPRSAIVVGMFLNLELDLFTLLSQHTLTYFQTNRCRSRRHRYRSTPRQSRRRSHSPRKERLHGRPLQSDPHKRRLPLRPRPLTTSPTRSLPRDVRRPRHHPRERRRRAPPMFSQLQHLVLRRQALLAHHRHSRHEARDRKVGRT